MNDPVPFPSSLAEFTQADAIRFMDLIGNEYLVPIYGVNAARVITHLDKPHTIKELENLVGKSYYSIRDTIADLVAADFLVATIYQHQRGRSYQVDTKKMLVNMSTTPAGQILLQQNNIEIPQQQAWAPDRSTIYSQFPTPVGPVLQIKLGNENTDVFKMVTVSEQYDSSLAQMFQTAGFLMYHVWYRSYLQTVEKVQASDLQAPNMVESRAAFRAISKQIRDYSKMLDSIAENELVWSDSSTFETWRILGDLPMHWAKIRSRYISQYWQEGRVSATGYHKSMLSDYETRRDFLDNHLKVEWAKYQATRKDLAGEL